VIVATKSRAIMYERCHQGKVTHKLRITPKRS
jgi:hypothetical protein